jgi:hypothetical protein
MEYYYVYLSLGYFPYFEKVDVGLWDCHAVGVSVCLWIPPINFWMYEPIFMKLGVYIVIYIVVYTPQLLQEVT